MQIAIQSRFSHYLVLIPYFIIVGFFLSLSSGAAIYPLAEIYDSLRYLEMSEHLLHLQWLGDYHQLTLIRPPLYSLLITISHISHIPLVHLQQFFYLFSIISIIIGLRQLGIPHTLLYLLYSLCLLHPIAFYPHFFIATESLYISFCNFFIASCIGFHACYTRFPRVALLWLVGYNLSIILIWHLRPEGIWLVPAGIFLNLYWIYYSHTTHIAWRYRYYPGLLFPLLGIYLFTLTIQHFNQKYYHISVYTELHDTGLKKTLNWLTRIAPEQRQRYIPVSHFALQQAYQVSPHFATLAPFLSQNKYAQSWAAHGCQWMGICDEIAGGWTIWAIRDAASKAGYYRDPLTAQHFYQNVAKELQQACHTHAIHCSANMTGNYLAPPLIWQDIPVIFTSIYKLFYLLLDFKDFTQGYKQLAQLPENPPLLEKYQAITLDTHSNQAKVNHFLSPHIRFFQGIHYLSCLMIILLLVYLLFTCPQHPLHILSAFLLLLFSARLVLISYLDAMSFFAQIRYLMVLYPILFILLVLLCHTTMLIYHDKKTHAP